MIIYDKRKPKTFDGANCIGITGENLATTQEFLINGMNDITVDYYIHLRFADGSVNSVIPDSVTVNKLGTKIVWKVKKNDIFMHGYFELQLEGRGENGYVFQTQIVTLYADESIPIEDKEYLNPNSETLKLREEVQKNLDETKNQQSKIDENRKIIEQSNLSLKENISNKIEDRRQIVNQSENYPSIKYLETYYLPATMSYECDELDEMFAAKADKATTLAGYGITDAYTKDKIKSLLAGKLDAMSFDSKPTLNSPCYLTSGTVYNALLAKADVNSVYSKVETDNLLRKKADKADVETVKSEITAARDTFDNLGERLDNLLPDEVDVITTDHMRDGSVKTNKIADATVTASKLSRDLLTLINSVANKADKADVDTALMNKANLVNSSNIFDFDIWAKGLQGLTFPVHNGTLDKVDYNEKSITFTATENTEKNTYTNGWNSEAAGSMKISVKPNTKYWVYYIANNYACTSMVFLNGITTDGALVTIKGGKGTFVTNNDTSFITIRFGSHNYGTFKVSEIMIAEKESIYLPNEVAEGVPEVADEVFAFEKTTQTLLDKKYDSSNIETGKGNLAPAQAIYDGYEGSFNYVKIGKTVTVALNITTLVAGKNYVQFAGLPFKAMTASKLSSIAVYTTANKLVNLRLDGTWLYVSSPDTTFADGEKINAIITYIIG